MVRIHVGRDDCEEEFLYDCSSTLPVSEIASDIVRISNIQSNIRSLSLQFEPRLLALRDDPKGIALLRTLTEARSYVSKDQVLHNKPLSLHILKDYLQTVEEEFISHCELLGFRDSSQLHQLLAGGNMLKEDTTQLWWAGKELSRGERLSKYTGNNDKTRIVLRLKSAGTGTA